MIQPITEHQLYNKLMQHSECTIKTGAMLSAQSSAIEITNYDNGENIAVECVKCNEVIFDINLPIYGGE